MKGKFYYTKNYKISYSILQKLILFIIVLTIPLVIYSQNINDDFGGNYEGNPDDEINGNNCNITNFFLGKCEMNFENEEDKILFKYDIYYMITNGSLDSFLDGLEEHLIAKVNTEYYSLFKTKNQMEYENITYIDYEDYSVNNNENQDIISFKIDYVFPGFNYPIVENFLFTKIDGNFTQIQINNIILKYSLPQENINPENMYIYNSSSDYYQDECTNFKSKNGTDISIYARKNEYNTKHLSLCQVGCKFIIYNQRSSEVECSCESMTLTKFSLISEIVVNNENQFKIKESASNFGLIKCYYLITSIKDIKKNPGFYLLVFVLAFLIVIFFIFIIKGYSSLSERIDEAIKFKFHPSKDNKNNKLIVIKMKNNNNNINIGKSTKIKKNKRNKTNKNSKNDGIKRKKTSARNSNNLSSVSRNNFMAMKNGRESINENKDESVFIFENDYEINYLNFDQAVKCDKRTFCEFYCSYIKTKQLLLFSFFDFNSYNSRIVKPVIFFLSFVQHYGINAFFFTDKVMNSIYENGSVFDDTVLINSLPSAVVSTVLIRLMTDFLVLTEKGVLNAKNQKTEDKANEEKKNVLKNACIKIPIFFIINIILLIFFWFYLTCFNAVFPNTQIYLAINTVLSFAMTNIFPLLYNLVPAFFRNDILKNKKIKKIKLKTSNEYKDAEYVYSVSQLLQKI
jgi:hypothetical protein